MVKEPIPKAEEKKEVKPLPKTEKPLGEVAEAQAASAEQATEPSDGEVMYRKFDSEDIVRMRDGCVLIQVECKDEKNPNQVKKLKEKSSVNIGQMQKITTCLGIKKCPWFADVITEELGVTDEIYVRRMKEEYRKIPIPQMDKVFKEAQKFNNLEFNPAELQKNL